MVFYKFKSSDKLINKLKTHPRFEFSIVDGSVFKDGNSNSYVDLYETVSGTKPFTYKQSDRYILKTVKNYNLSSSLYGTKFEGSYPQTSSLVIEQYTTANNQRLMALENVFESYRKNSPEFEFRRTNNVKHQIGCSLVNIPSIFYGSSIKKGSLVCKMYVTGALVGEIRDSRKNGELVQVGPYGSTKSGSVAGVVLYNEGLLYMSGAWSLNAAHSEVYIAGDPSDNPKWKYFAFTGSQAPKTSYSIEFEGTHEIPVLTLYANAERGELNSSTNPTYIAHGQTVVETTGSTQYTENNKLSIPNLSKNSHIGTGSFEKEVYISSIGVYDEDKKLVGIAKLARPIKKDYSNSYSFKLKMDL